MEKSYVSHFNLISGGNPIIASHASNSGNGWWLSDFISDDSTLLVELQSGFTLISCMCICEGMYWTDI